MYWFAKLMILMEKQINLWCLVEAKDKTHCFGHWALLTRHIPVVLSPSFPCLPHSQRGDNTSHNSVSESKGPWCIHSSYKHLWKTWFVQWLYKVPKRNQERLHRGRHLIYSSHVKFYLHFLHSWFEKAAVNILFHWNNNLIASSALGRTRQLF